MAPHTPISQNFALLNLSILGGRAMSRALEKSVSSPRRSAEQDKRQALQQQGATCPIFCRLSVPPIQSASSASGARVATRPRVLAFPRFSPGARLIKVFQCEAVVDNTLTAAER